MLSGVRERRDTDSGDETGISRRRHVEGGIIHVVVLARSAPRRGRPSLSIGISSPEARREVERRARAAT